MKLRWFHHRHSSSPVRSALACLGLLGLTVPLQAAEYRWLNSWDNTQAQIPMFADPYVKAIEAATAGRVKLNVSGPETVPAFEQLQPVASGAFQFLYTHGAYHFGSNSLLAAVEAINGTIEQRRSPDILAAVSKSYEKMGLKVLVFAMTSDGGYQIVLRKPPTPAGDLQGHKIRGNPTYQPVLRMLGASMVTMPPSELYTALDKGVVDGTAFTGYGIADLRLHEVAKYILRPKFAYSASAVLVNLAAWNKIPEADRKIILDEGAKAADNWYKASAKLIADDEKQGIAKGMQVVDMGEAQKGKLKRAWSDGLWELTSQKFKADVDALRAVAKAKGID